MSGEPLGAFRLLNGNAAFVVEPLVGPRRGERFDLPRLALSQIVWLSSLTKQFYARHQRCMTVLLELDLERRTWGSPRIPVQRCWAAGSAWSTGAETLRQREGGLVIGGTFVSTTVASLSEFLSLPPTFDGLHFVCGVGEANSFLLGFATTDGQPRMTPAGELLVDDWARFLEDNVERMRFD